MEFVLIYFLLAILIAYLRGVALRRIREAGFEPIKDTHGSTWIGFFLWPLVVPSLFKTLGQFPRTKR